MLFSLQNLDAKERRLGMTKRQYCRKIVCICTDQKPEAAINLFLRAKQLHPTLCLEFVVVT